MSSVPPGSSDSPSPAPSSSRSAAPSRSSSSSAAGGAKVVTVRRARTADVPAVRLSRDGYVQERILLGKPTVTLYEDIQEFWVAERDEDAEVVGCGALHV